VIRLHLRQLRSHLIHDLVAHLGFDARRVVLGLLQPLVQARDLALQRFDRRLVLLDLGAVSSAGSSGARCRGL